VVVQVAAAVASSGGSSSSSNRTGTQSLTAHVGRVKLAGPSH
jgi:hypothetical protein